MKIDITIEVTNTGYSACAEKYAAFTTGATLEELKANMLEAMNLYFEKESKTIHTENLIFNRA